MPIARGLVLTCSLCSKPQHLVGSCLRPVLDLIYTVAITSAGPYLAIRRRELAVWGAGNGMKSTGPAERCWQGRAKSSWSLRKAPTGGPGQRAFRNSNDVLYHPPERLQLQTWPQPIPGHERVSCRATQFMLAALLKRRAERKPSRRGQERPGSRRVCS